MGHPEFPHLLGPEALEGNNAYKDSSTSFSPPSENAVCFRFRLERHLAGMTLKILLQLMFLIYKCTQTLPTLARLVLPFAAWPTLFAA